MEPRKKNKCNIVGNTDYTVETEDNLSLHKHNWCPNGYFFTIYDSSLNRNRASYFTDGETVETERERKIKIIAATPQNQLKKKGRRK